MINIILIIVPLIAIGIVVVLLINNLKKNNEKRNTLGNENYNKCEQSIEKD